MQRNAAEISGLVPRSKSLETLKSHKLERRLVAAAALWGLGAILYLAAETISACFAPGYHYLQDYISVLGEPGSASPLSEVMNCGFIAEGVLYVAASCLAFSTHQEARTQKGLLTLGLLHGVGIVVVGIFHGGQPSGSTPALHPIGAFMAIAGGNLASVAYRKLDPTTSVQRLSLILGSTGLACLFMLGVNIRLGQVVVFPDAVWERGSVYAIIAWELLISVSIFGSALR